MCRAVSGRKPFAGSSVVIRLPLPVILITSCRDQDHPSSPLRNAHLGLHKINVGDLLGDGVLDLDPWIHLDEDVLARTRPFGSIKNSTVPAQE